MRRLLLVLLSLLAFPRVDFVEAQELRVRTNIRRLTPAQLESLKRGVRVMKSRPAQDPRSWQFQANIHGVTGPATDPLFDQCQHGTLHFFTWHRAYLHFFERILRQASGDPDLQLPYWDWSVDRDVPFAFRDGSAATNPLFHPRALNSGALLPALTAVTDRNRALAESLFVDFSPALEGSPHGAIHVQVGGSGGDMSSIGRSANDPIFWLHHCNIDRLWNMWLNASGHVNPNDISFLDQEFRFADEAGQRLTIRVRDFIDSQRLNYRYDDVPNPASPLESLASTRITLPPRDGQHSTDVHRDHAHGVPQTPAVAAPSTRVGDAAQSRTRLLVASSAPQRNMEEAAGPPVKLGLARKAVELRPARTGGREAVAPTSAGRLILEVHGLRAKAPPPVTYAVYLNLPADESNPDRLEKYYVRSLNFFGLAEHDAAGEHAGHAPRPQEFDVTDIARQLKETKEWDPERITVTLVPIAPTPPRERGQAENAEAQRAVTEADVSFDRIDLRLEPATRGPRTLRAMERVGAAEKTLSIPRRVALPKPPMVEMERPFTGPAGLPRANPHTNESAALDARFEELITERRRLAKQLDLFDARVAKHLESICGPTTDFQDVERYDGSLGVPVAFVNAHEAAIGQLQWIHDLPDRFNGANDSPGNVNGVRWGSGGLISRDLFLTAGHCFDQDGGGWDMPRRNGQVIRSDEIAQLMKVNFKFQVDSASGRIRVAESFPVMELIEYREGNLDYALVRLGPGASDVFPGDKYGWLPLAEADTRNGETVCLIQHPNGLPKKIHAGPVRDVVGAEVSYATLDTLGGSSGSPILGPTGLIVGVHTNGGCMETGGANFGVAIREIRRQAQVPPLAARQSEPETGAARQGTRSARPD